ncbi:hypothetical protein N5D61_03435 [Pseudomonas sp. GD03842]|uniref:hypothetical protein n=1 Tax=Pseudomonas sp. GD03842 TaxID=2975385 RepID=UPI0024470CCC|nr:hypothetical protein [Pseudomonas sp. GD03842]MDH0745398.1 hypothetical protein [Pseudomonas sp. GD03842]
MSTIKQKPTILRIDNDREPIPIEAPDIPVAFHDADNFGLIPVSALDAPITVNLKVWEGAGPGYTYQLVWDGKAHGPAKPINASENPGDPLTLELEVELQTEGVHALGFVTFSPNTGVSDYSAVMPIVIDRTAPGKPHLGMIHFPVEVQNGLTLAELERLGNKLTVEVAGYNGMAKHDVIQTYWGLKQGPTATVTEDDMGFNKVIFDFKREFLETIESGPQQVYYTVSDRAGNVSDNSLTAEILLLLEEIPNNFPAPILDPETGDLIDYAEARAGVQVDIPHYPGAAAFDQITLYWGADRPMYPVELPAGNEDESIVLSLRVPYETIAAVPIGQVSLSYSVSRQNQLSGSSLPAVANVYISLPIPVPSAPPIIQGTSIENPNKEDNFIDEDDYQLNSRAIVAWSDDFRINDDLNLYWGDQQRLQWHQISEEDVAAKRDLVIPIANSIMKAQGTGAEIPVHYSVTRSGNPNATSSPVQTVTVRSKEELPGGAEGIEGPLFELTPAGYISLIVAPDGTEGLIKPYKNIAENQKLFFTFKGFDIDNNIIEAATLTATRVLDDIDIVNGYKFSVPYNTLRTICNGYCEAYVRVEPAAGSNQSAVTSKTTRVPVDMRRTNENVCSLRP